MDDFPCKSSEKSSPSFPEDADYDDEQMPTYNHPESNEHPPSVESPVEKLSSDVTLMADDDDDEMEGIKPLTSNLDSPKPNTDVSDKKVHWTTQNVKLLLARVEEHLSEFNVQKKHKAVWQSIGAEMEPYGFTTEHCYNKWKNLRRDVRLLVNNPQKVVRNADILRRVAQLILFIYPNVDANTLQVCDRSGQRSLPSTPRCVGGVKSLPATPGGQGASNKMTSVNVNYSGFNSPDCKMSDSSSLRPSNNIYGSIGPVSVHSTPTSVVKNFSGTSKSNNVPATALFVDSVSNGDKMQAVFNQGSHPEPDSTGPFPFPFNQAAVDLFLQSHVFSDLLKQQQQQQQLKCQMESNPQDQLHDLSSIVHNGAPNPLSTLQQVLSNPPNNDLNVLSTVTANLLHSLAALTPQVNGSECPTRGNNSNAIPANNTQNPLLGLFPNLPTGLLERFIPSTSEITEIIETLRAEDDAQFRVAEMISEAAEQLRRASQRRQAAIEKLLDLLKRQANGNSASVGDSNGTVT